MSKITPVVVVGMNRSGTRWLTTLIGSHPEISCILAKNNQRSSELCLETNMFSVFPDMYGDLSDVNKYIAMVEQWLTTQFGKNLEIDRRNFYSFDPRPTNCIQLFNKAMNSYSIKRKTSFWTQKTPPKYLDRIIKNIPAAKYIFVSRGVEANIRSKVKRAREASGNQVRSYNLPHLLFLYVSDMWLINQGMKNKQIATLHVKFEDLVADKEKELRRICTFLSLQYSDEMLRSELYKNSRFESNTQKMQYLTNSEIRKIHRWKTLFSLIPGRILWLIRKNLGGRSKVSEFINATFRSVKEEYELWE